MLQHLRMWCTSSVNSLVSFLSVIVDSADKHAPIDNKHAMSTRIYMLGSCVQAYSHFLSVDDIKMQLVLRLV